MVSQGAIFVLIFLSSEHMSHVVTGCGGQVWGTESEAWSSKKDPGVLVRVSSGGVQQAWEWRC